MKKPGEKREDLCIVAGCKNRRERDNWRCEKHSVMYYGGMVGIDRNVGLGALDVDNE